MTQFWGYTLPGDIIDRIRRSVTIDDAASVASVFAADIGFHKLTFHLAKGQSDTAHILHLITNYPQEWVNRYIERGYAHADPVHRRTLSAVSPFVWSEITQADLDPKAAGVFREAHEFGIRDGLTVPLHSPTTTGVFSALAAGSSTERAETLQRAVGAMTLLAMHLHERVQAEIPFSMSYETLTEREREVLQLVAIGKTSSEISEILAIAESTVKVHATRCCAKLQASNRTMAAVRAQQIGLIDVV